MAENILSCFIDEAGDFGDFEAHSPYYIVSVIAHEQSNSIQAEIDGLERYLSGLGYAHHAIHTAPLIRLEGDYQFLDMETRKKLFNLLFRFARSTILKRKSILGSFPIQRQNSFHHDMSLRKTTGGN